MSTIAGARDLAATLDGIIRRHGSAVLGNRPRLNALLRDHAPDDLRAVRVLMNAFDAGAPERLRALPRPIADADIAAEAARMVEEFGSDPDLARAAVVTWARVAANLREQAPSNDAGAAPIPIRPLPLPGDLKGAAIQPLPVAARSGRDRPLSRLTTWSAIVAGALVLLAALLRMVGAL